MQLGGSHFLGAAVLAACAARGACSSVSFGFTPGTYDAAGLYAVLYEHYYQYAATWSQQLSIAKASYTDAYAVLTSIYNTDAIPPTPDPAFISHLASEMVKIGPTTVVDSNDDPGTPTSVATKTPTSTPTATATSTGESESEPDSSSEPGHDSSPESKQKSDTDRFSLDSDDHETDSSPAAPNTKPAAALCGIVAALAIAVTSGLF
ncbi:hypothetical protein IWQ57_005374 [Coemansia nantahalensis]|uniref:Uncharacterized protein n=1 Tax=Coemansia nantahalensis TaxID=2789366 RepID=A0ACC1JN36_9FUNG|nr:hypothetical protein IWQ57_005374 [Coemansia nantahalensis]